MKAEAKRKLDEFCRSVDEIVRRGGTEKSVTAQVQRELAALLADPGFGLERADAPPVDDHYVMYPLYVAADESFSVAAAVWNVGQETPVHGHETWGVVGIVSGVERETAYIKPRHTGRPLEPTETTDWLPGEVTVCCTTDDDVHWVACGGDVPCVGIHVYGANIGTLQRRRYDPATSESSWFVSSWSQPVKA